MSSNSELTDNEISLVFFDTDDGSDLPDLDQDSDADEDFCVVVGEDGLGINFSKEGESDGLVVAEENPADIPPPADKSKGPMWDNKKLFPPSVKCKSRAWQFGGFIQDSSGQLLTKETICGICGKRQKYRNSPTNLDQHVQANHTFQYDTSGAGKGKESIKEGKINDYFKSETSAKYKPNHPKQKAVRSKLCEWVVKSNRAIAEVEDSKLIEAFSIADPKIKLPTRHTVTRDIKKLYNKKRLEFDQVVSKIEHFAGNNDAGSSSNNKSFVAVNVSYVTEDFHLKKKILDVLEMPEDKSAVNYRKRVHETEENHGIGGKVFIYTTDNENTMKAAFRNHERSGCFAHIESKASKKALDKQAVLKKLRLKLRKIAKKSNKSPKFKYALINQQRTRGLSQKTLKQEVKTRFTATHTMIRSFLNDPNEGFEEPIDVNKVKENIKAVNDAMIEAKFSKTDLDKLEITPDNLKTMIKLAPILDALEEGITLLGAEKYATGSSVLPFEKKFYKLLESDEDDPIYLARFKRDFMIEMKTRCDANLNRKVLAKASFFDKRFEKIERFLEETDVENVISEIKSELDDIERAMEVEVIELRNNNEEPARKKKKRFLGSSFLDSEDDKNTAEKEFVKYRAEPKLKSDGCPFQWWRSRSLEYPLMARLARKYLAVSGTSTPSERVISRLGLVLTKRRLSMKGNLFSKIMFLSDIV